MQETFTLAIEQETPAVQPDSISLMPIELIETEIKARAGMITENIIIIGNMLQNVKGRLEHGQFLNWLRDRVNFSLSTANNFMRIAREIPRTPGLVNLPYTKALALLDLPEDDREQFAQDIKADKKSTRQIQQLVREKEDAEKARIAAENLAKETAVQLEAQTRIATRQQSLVEQYSQQFYDENERANQLEAQLQNARNAMPEPVSVEVPPADYEQIKAKAAQEKQRADEAEAYAMEQEAERHRIASELRKLRETKAEQPLAGNSPLSLDSFSSTIKQFVAQVGIAPNMAPFFRAMGPDTLRAYGQWVDVLEEWIIGTKEAIGEGAQYVDAHESAVV